MTTRPLIPDHPGIDAYMREAIRITGDCWIWQGAVDTPRPPAAIRIFGYRVHVSCYLFSLFSPAEIPKNQHVAPTCGNPACVRPAHQSLPEPGVHTLFGRLQHELASEPRPPRAKRRSSAETRYKASRKALIQQGLTGVQADRILDGEYTAATLEQALGPSYLEPARQPQRGDHA